jgi:hypothetical protein
MFKDEGVLALGIRCPAFRGCAVTSSSRANGSPLWKLASVSSEATPVLWLLVPYHKYTKMRAVRIAQVGVILTLLLVYGLQMLRVEGYENVVYATPVNAASLNKEDKKLICVLTEARHWILSSSSSRLGLMFCGYTYCSTVLAWKFRHLQVFKALCLLRFSNIDVVCIYNFPCKCLMSFPSHSSWLTRPKNFKWWVQTWREHYAILFLFTRLRKIAKNDY